MLKYAESTFIGKGTTRIYVGEHDLPLQRAAGERGFVMDSEPCVNYMIFDLTNIHEPELPEGYRFVSTLENNDLEKRREVGGLSFYHTDPDDWATLYSYEQLQKAPDYRKELDIVVERSDGKWVVCTISWFDSYNRMGTLEPVGAIQLGMGREVVMEGLRRLKALGAEVAHMDAGLKYYERIGFREQFKIYRWVKTH